MRLFAFPQKLGMAIPVSLLGFLAGCGLSPAYQRASLENASNFEVCYAAADMRGGGWAVRRSAANQIVAERGLRCDYEQMARIHTLQSVQDANQMAASAALMNASATLMQQAQPRYLPASPSQVSCVQQGVFTNCSAY